MRVFVTGGAGFIGRHLVKSFLEKNFKVTIFDNFSNSSKEMVSDLINDRARLVKGDITNFDDISRCIKNSDVVIHLASKINVQESILNPKLTKAVNVDGVKNLLEACKEHNITNIIIVSSAAVYGNCIDPKIHLSENSTTNPISPYGKSKLEMEKAVIEFAKKHDCNAVILRFFNIYGIGQSPEYAGVITKFLQKIHENKSLEIYGDGLQTRDFVSVDDVVDIINKVFTKMKGRRGDVYNIASGKAISINDLAKILISVSGKNLNAVYLPEKKGDIRFSQADISLAKKELDYSPKVDLESGVRDLYFALCKSNMEFHGD